MGCWIANKFLLDGDSVILTYSREYEPSIVIMKRDFLQAGPRLATIPIDFLGPEAITGIFDTAATRFHRLDIVVSAVSNGYYPHISQITPEALDWAFAVNPRAQLSIAQQAYKHVTFGGRLILTSSIEGAVAESYPRLSIHSGFKAAIQAFAQSLAIGTNQSGPHLVYRDRTDVYPDFGPREITVNAIAARGIKHEEGHGQARLFIPSANIMSDDDLNEVSQARKVPGCISS